MIPSSRLGRQINEVIAACDSAGIRALLRANKDVLDMAEVREYFHLFNKEQLLDELMQQL